MQRQEVHLPSHLIDVSTLTLDQLDQRLDESPFAQELRAILAPSCPQEAAAGFDSYLPPE